MRRYPRSPEAREQVATNEEYVGHDGVYLTLGIVSFTYMITSK